MQKLKQDIEYGIGNNLRRLRSKKKLTQKDVVAQLDFYDIHINRVTYNKMEHNYYSIRIKELLALKDIFQCDYNDFFTNLDIPKKSI